MAGSGATVQTPEEYLDALEEPRRTEMRKVHNLIRATAPDLDPVVQGSVLAYGPFHYRYSSGREGDWFVIGLASRKRAISLYVSASTDEGYLAESYRGRLPKADIGRSCVRFRRIDDLDRGALVELIRTGAAMGADLRQRLSP
jgi:hypothetical protein